MPMERPDDQRRAAAFSLRPSSVERYFAAAATATLPPLSVQSFSVFDSITPLPLHSFLPLQPPSPPLQTPLPLHSLMPEHMTDLALASLPLALAMPPTANIEATA